MTNRRNFLTTAAAGFAFCGCALKSPVARAAEIHKPVMIRGKRIKTVDVHAHCIFHEAADLLGDKKPSLTPPVLNSAEAYIVIADRLAAMDRQGIDMEVLSVNPFWYRLDRDLAAKIVGINNAKMGELCAAKPDRFAGFASLTMQDPALAVKELEAAMKLPGMKGAAIGDRCADWEYGDPRFHPVWAKAEELGASLFIHPQGSPELSPRLNGNGWLNNTIALPLGTTIALSHLIFQGTLDKFPNLKVIGAHGGGYLPSYAPRSDHACFVMPAGCDPSIKLKKKPTEYLNQLFFDALVFTPEALRHLVAQVGASQVMLGSDHPYIWEQHPIESLMATTSLSDAQKEAILGGNAAKLFKLKA